LVSFFYFWQPLDLAHARAVLRERLCAIPRFRSKVVRTGKRGMSCAFKELSAEELDAAMDRMVLQSDGIKTAQDVNEFVSRLSTENTDLDLPLWRGWVLNDMTDGRSALMLMIDHAIGDGVALIQVLMSVLDPSTAKCPPQVPSRRLGGAAPGCCTCLKGLFQACWGLLVADRLPADPPNRLKVKDHRHVGRAKAFSTSQSLTMGQIRAVREKLPGSTVSDVLATVTALTLQEYFRRYEPSTLQQKLRANFPINLRPVAGNEIMTEEHFGNRVALGQLRFPLHLDDPLQVYAHLKRQIDAIKVSPEPLLRDRLLGLFVLRCGLRPTRVADLLLDTFGKVTAMVSSVPGPVDTVELGGQPLDDLAFYAIAPLGLYFGIVQYKGSFKVGVACDAGCEPEPSRLSECWAPAFEQLRAAAAAL